MNPKLLQAGWSGREWPVSGGVENSKDGGISHFELVGKKRALLLNLPILSSPLARRVGPSHLQVYLTLYLCKYQPYFCNKLLGIFILF